MSYREFYGYGNGMAGITVVPLMIAESPELREAATQAKKLYDETTVDLSMRKDVFEKLVAYQKNLDDGAENIDPEYRRALDKIIRSGKKNGKLICILCNEFKNLINLFYRPSFG